MPSVPSRRGAGELTAKAVETRRRILDAALEVLRDRGHAGFSIPGVAAAAGVFPGNVTYYFPTRAVLIAEVVGHVLERVRDDLGPRIATMLPLDASSAAQVCEAIFDRAISPSSVALYPELWSIANRYPEVASAIRDVHLAGVDALTVALGADPGDPAAAPMRSVLRVLTTVANGLTAMHGHRTADDPIVVEIRRTAVSMLAPQLALAAHGVTRPAPSVRDR